MTAITHPVTRQRTLEGSHACIHPVTGKDAHKAKPGAISIDCPFVIARSHEVASHDYRVADQVQNLRCFLSDIEPTSNSSCSHTYTRRGVSFSHRRLQTCCTSVTSALVSRRMDFIYARPASAESIRKSRLYLLRYIIRINLH